MKISIITPTNNSENNIDKCVQSIISQTYKNFEHIVVDNLSTDRTVEIVKNIYLINDLSSKLRIISEKDGGISDAFNKGIEAATGDIITILNSDDYYFSQNVFEEVNKAFNNPKIMFVHGNILFKDDFLQPLLQPQPITRQATAAQHHISPGWRSPLMDGPRTQAPRKDRIPAASTPTNMGTRCM